MRIVLDEDEEASLVEQARQQIVSALHAGLLHPGARLPSVRCVARSSGLNPKTVLRVYERLRDEGLIELRAGSGSFVTGQEPSWFDPARVMSLRRLIRRHLDEASAMNLTPAGYLSMVQRFVSRDALSTMSVAVLECNLEQVRVFSREIGLRLNVKAHPVLVEEIGRKTTAGLLARCSAVVATDFHLEEATRAARQHGKPVVGLRLQRDFLPALMEAARHGRLAMIVSDTGFFPAFKKSLSQLGLKREYLERVRVAAGHDRAAARQAMAEADAIYISPLCDRMLRQLAPHDARLLSIRDHIATESIEELEAWLLLSGAAPRS